MKSASAFRDSFGQDYGVTIADGAVIHSFSHLTQAKIGEKAEVGPFTRLRPGASLGERVKVGNFVEIKASTLEAGAKASHLAYIGDTEVGANSNIGAGTVTCNYDGFGKHKTTIGKGAFVGTNTSLVAPVKIGDTVTVIVTVAELMPEKSRARLTCVCKVGRQVVLDGEALVKVPREEKGKRPMMRL